MTCVMCEGGAGISHSDILFISIYAISSGALMDMSMCGWQGEILNLFSCVLYITCDML